MGEWKVEGVGEWKCKESVEKVECLDWEMLEWMCEKSLLESVNDVIVVKVF